jgi:hypothetical protein
MNTRKQCPPDGAVVLGRNALVRSALAEVGNQRRASFAERESQCHSVRGVGKCGPRRWQMWATWPTCRVAASRASARQTWSRTAHQWEFPHHWIDLATLTSPQAVPTYITRFVGQTTSRIRLDHHATQVFAVACQHVAIRVHLWHCLEG